MKKNILAFFIPLSLVLLPSAAFVLADDPQVDPNLDVFAALGRIADYAFTLLLVVGVIALLWAGFMFITANGDPEKLNKAKMMVVYSIIGILLATMSRGIVGLIRGVVK
jgi:hypothetical protein